MKNHQRELKRILIIHPEGNSFNNPTLKCIIDLLIQRGCEIDLRYKSFYAPMPALDGVKLLPYKKTLSRVKTVLVNKVCVKKLIFLYVLLEKLFLYKNNYDLIIGVDRQGLIEADMLSKITSTPYVLISFEIMFESETSARYKSLEREASKNVALWIVQDKVRAQQLQNENRLNPAKRYLLPLASAGFGQMETKRLRDDLGIPRNKKVAIVIGSISKWSMVGQILMTTKDWSDDWVLIVHERYGNTYEILKKECAAIIHELKDKKIFISDAAIDMVDDMGFILSGVSIGFAFYEPDFSGPYTGNNLKYLGLASGKISTYLRYGVPVILNEIGLYAEEARRFRFGCVVQQPVQIKEKLDEIYQEEYKNSAMEYFSDKLDFNIYRDEIFSRILSAHRLLANTDFG